MGVPHMVIVPRLVSESMRCSTLVMPRSAILCGEERRFRVIGPLLPGGGANLRTFPMLGGGSDPPSKKFTTLGGEV